MLPPDDDRTRLSGARPAPAGAGRDARAERPRSGLAAAGALFGGAALAVGYADDPGSRLRLLGLVGGVLALVLATTAGRLPGRVARWLVPLAAAGVALLGLVDLALRWVELDPFALLALCAAAGLLASWIGGAGRRLRGALLQVALFLGVFAAAERVIAATLPIHEYVPVPDDPAMGPYLVRDAGGRAVGQPGFRGRYEHYEFPGVRVELNALGLRDDPADVRPLEQGEACVLVLGDSVVFGTGVPVEETFHALLEERAEELTDRPLRVIGAGMPGYGPYDAWQALRALGRRLPPDVVVLGVFEANDFQDNWTRRQGASAAAGAEEDDAEAVPAGPAATAPRARLDGFARELLRPGTWSGWQSALEKQARWVQGLLADAGLRTRVRTNRFLDLALLREPPPVVREVEDGVLATLEDVRTSSHELGAELVLLVIPAYVQADPARFEEFLSLRPPEERGRYDRTAFHRSFVERLRERGFYVVDTLGFAEQGVRSGRSVYHPEGHWNARGHAAAAESLVGPLRDAL